MPAPTGKGKIPLKDVAAYDPNSDASPNISRIKTQKGTSKSNVVGKTKRSVQS